MKQYLAPLQIGHKTRSASGLRIVFTQNQVHQPMYVSAHMNSFKIITVQRLML